MPSRQRNVASEIKAFWHRVVKKRGLAHAVKWSVDASGDTVIEIKDRLPYLPFFQALRGRPSFVVSMKGYLSRAHFGASDDRDEQGRQVQTARGQINRNENKARGRVVFLSRIDANGRDEDLAAVSFHVDESQDTPLILRAVALRVDSPDANALSRAAAGWLLFYLAEASLQIRGIREVGADTGKAGNLALLQELGFTNRPRPAGFAVAGRYIAFRPPGG